MKKLLLLALVVLPGLNAAIEFSGFFITSKEALFSLADGETKQSSGWLKIGQGFAGYTVQAFDREREIITLKHGDRSLDLALRQSVVQAAKATIRGTIKLSSGEQIKDVQASMFFGEESVFPLGDSVSLHLTPTLTPDGNVRYGGTITQRAADGKEEKISAPSIITRRNQAFALRIGDFSFEFKP